MMDLHYPTRLHNRHDDYPLAPESLVNDRDMYSSTQQAVVLPICGIKSSTQYIIVT